MIAFFKNGKYLARVLTNVEFLSALISWLSTRYVCFTA